MAFIRAIPSRDNPIYLHQVRSRRVEGQVKQEVESLGRADSTNWQLERPRKEMTEDEIRLRLKAVANCIIQYSAAYEGLRRLLESKIPTGALAYYVGSDPIDAIPTNSEVIVRTRFADIDYLHVVEYPVAEVEIGGFRARVPLASLSKQPRKVLPSRRGSKARSK